METTCATYGQVPFTPISLRVCSCLHQLLDCDRNAMYIVYDTHPVWTALKMRNIPPVFYDGCADGGDAGRHDARDDGKLEHGVCLVDEKLCQ